MAKELFDAPFDGLVIAAGSDCCRDADRLPLRAGALVICADAGVAACRQLGLAPGIVVGDLDSALPEQVEWARAAGARVQQHPADKNQTDLELALDEAVRLGWETIAVTGVTGGRPDHTLANIDVLLGYARRGLCVTVVEEWGEIFFLAGAAGGQASIRGDAGDIVSLIPRCGGARDVHTAGLHYLLDGDDLHYGASRGVSNYMLATVAGVSLGGGELLAVHLRARA